MLDNDEQEIGQIVETGLEEILSGRASMDDVIKRHPSIAEILRPELESALWLIEQSEQVRPRPGYIAASRKRLVGRIKQEANSRGAKRAFLGFNWSFRFPAFQWVAAILIVVIFFSVSGGVVSAAQESIPGQELYSVKRFTEQVIFDLTSNNVQQVELSSDFADRRLIEVESLIMRNEFELARQTLVDFESQVNKTVYLLETVDEDSTREKLGLAENLDLDLTRRADRLQSLLPGAPVTMHDELTSARDVSIEGASQAREVSDRIKELDQLFTRTPLPTYTFTLTLTQTATQTPFPTSTATPIIVVITADPVDSSSDVPNLIATFTPERRYIIPGLTKTARPANENKPEKEEKEPKDVKPPKNDKSPSSDD